MRKKILILTILIFTVVFVSCSPKSVKNKEITIKLPVGERTGYYTGEVNEGVPHGIGKFETKNAAGEKWFYEGEFKNGIFNGEGKTIWESGQTQQGFYENGKWVPNSKQLFEFFESQNSIHINSKAKQFLSDHLDFFPTGDINNILDYVDESIMYKMLTKEINEYGNKIMKMSNLYVASITANDLFQFSIENKVSRILAVDDKYNVYELYCIGDLNDIYDGDIIKNVFGIPLGLNSFENVGGGTTNTVQIAICYIEE